MGKKIKRSIFLLATLILTCPSLAYAQESFARTYLSTGWLSTALLIGGFVLLLLSLFVDRPLPALIISFICFALFFWGKISIGSISPMEMIFFILGVILLIMELFIPGFSLPGIIGIIFIVFGVYNMSGSTEDALLNVFLILLISVIFIIYMFTTGFKSDRFNKITLNTSIGDEDKDKKEGHIQVGDQAITSSILRPYGFIDYEGRKFDATAESDHIEKGKQVIVTEIIGNKIIVKELDD